MRLWHQKLIPYLPRLQLLGQHRECCALRGNGWGKKHRTVDYVFKRPPHYLYEYHRLIMDEMKNRGYNVSKQWLDDSYRGKNCHPYLEHKQGSWILQHQPIIYLKHNDSYLQECLLNLDGKGIKIVLS